VLGAVISELDDIVCAERENLPTPASPILPLHLRFALLAGVAIVERVGPEMLGMLRNHTMGDNRTRFRQIDSPKPSVAGALAIAVNLRIPYLRILTIKCPPRSKRTHSHN
jgi:hypothetical protein